MLSVRGCAQTSWSPAPFCVSQAGEPRGHIPVSPGSSVRLAGGPGAEAAPPPSAVRVAPSAGAEMGGAEMGGRPGRLVFVYLSSLLTAML